MYRLVCPDYVYKDAFIQVGEFREYPNELYYSQDDGCWRLGKKTRSGEWGPGWGERQQPRRVDNIEYQSEGSYLISPQTNILVMIDKYSIQKPIPLLCAMQWAQFGKTTTMPMN